MATLKDRIGFAEKHIVSKEGRRFSLEGRDWVRDEYWRPFTGWKLWANDLERLCPLCKAQVGEIVDWSPILAAELDAHASRECAGLQPVPVLITLLNLPRREGKTFNTAAFALSTIFLEHRKSILYVASAGSQTQTMFHENFVIPIEQSPVLRKLAVIRGRTISVPKKNSVLEIVDTSAGSIAGRGRTHVVIDEARAVDAEAGMSAIPSVTDQSGFECPHGHSRSHVPEPGSCTVCGEQLAPWFGRIVVMSSAGRLKGGEADWFSKLCDSQEARPKAAAHVFRATESTNPAVNKETKSRIREVLDDVEELRELAAVEFENKFLAKGDSFLPEAVIKRCCVGPKENFSGSTLPCIGFLDTSMTTDLTSLVLVGHVVSNEAKPWSHLTTLRVDAWDPRDHGGHINPDLIMAAFDEIVPELPNLIEICVDTRGGARANVKKENHAKPWAHTFVRDCRATKTWGHKINWWHAQTNDRDASWLEFERRIIEGRIEFQAQAHGNWTQRLLAELGNQQKKKRTDGTVEVRDRVRNARHADIAEGYAAVCLMAFRLQHSIQRSLRELSIDERAQAVLDRLYQPPSAGGYRLGELNPDRF